MSEVSVQCQLSTRPVPNECVELSVTGSSLVANYLVHNKSQQSCFEDGISKNSKNSILTSLRSLLVEIASFSSYVCHWTASFKSCRPSDMVSSRDCPSCCDSQRRCAHDDHRRRSAMIQAATFSASTAEATRRVAKLGSDF